MAGENQELRIKMELLRNDEETQHLYSSESTNSEDVKPAVIPRPTPTISGYFELSSDDEISTRPGQVRKKRKRSSFFIRLVVKEVATQTDDLEKKDASINTDEVATVETGVNTDAPPGTAEIGVSTDDPLDVTADEDKVDDDNKSSKDIYYQCTICSCYYLSFNSLQKHSRGQHNKIITDQRKVSYEGNCKYCFASYVFSAYNQHIKIKHTDKFTIDGNTQTKKQTRIGPYECSICHARFISYNEAKRHRKSHENIENKFVLRKLKSETSPKKIQTPNRSIIPKDILFQCPKCELNFFTYGNAVRHRVACDRGVTKGIEEKCTKCEKKFLQGHIKNHNVQHEMTDVFQTHLAVDGVGHRIMYRCIKCKVCMEERCCRIHLQSGCVNCKGEPCAKCELIVHRSFVEKHRSAHEYMGLEKADIILVDICP